jgi:hypothetical protein
MVPTFCWPYLLDWETCPARGDAYKSDILTKVAVSRRLYLHDLNESISNLFIVGTAQLFPGPKLWDSIVKGALLDIYEVKHKCVLPSRYERGHWSVEMWLAFVSS